MGVNIKRNSKLIEGKDIDVRTLKTQLKDFNPRTVTNEELEERGIKAYKPLF